MEWVAAITVAWLLCVTTMLMVIGRNSQRGPTPHDEDPTTYQYLNEHTPGDELLAAGYTAQGWYFWDLKGVRCVGPYLEYDEAQEACRTYLRLAGKQGPP